MYITRKDHRPFAFAGLWETWHDPGGAEVRSCTIITTTPNELVRPIHDRMPAILDESTYQQWLSPQEQPAEALSELLKPYPAEQLEARAVSPAVNNPKNESPACVASPAQDSRGAEGGLFASS